MKKKSLIIALLLSFTISNAQKVIPLYDSKTPNSKDILGLTDTTAVYSIGKTSRRFVLRVASPDLTVFLPEKSKSTGIAVVICPGGAYVGLSIDNEGYDIAKKLNEKGMLVLF